MKFKLYIPYVNRIDLLYKAIKSVESVWDHIVLIDNSDEQNLDTLFLNIPPGVSIYKPEVSLTTAQTFNLIRKLALQDNLDFYLFMHNDGEAQNQDVVKTLIKLTTDRIEQKDRWGVIFTNYDVLCAFNTKAVKEVGLWDQLRFPFYFLDDDYYYRLESAGWKVIYEPQKCPVIHHNKSSTYKADPVRGLIIQKTFGICRELFQQKWGKIVKYEH